MRVFAAILAVILGSSAALAQSDPRANPAPAAEAKPVAKPETKAKNEPKSEPKKTEPSNEAKAEAEAKDGDAATNAKAKASRKEKAAAKAKPATNGSAAASAPPGKPSGLQDTYAAIPPAERMAIQNDLTWGGDFTGPIDGEFSERLVAAVKAYQSRHKNPVTGVMSPAERAALAAAVEPRKQEVGWRLVEDPVTGARLGLPGKFATKTTALQNGTRWASDQGQLQVETFRIDTGATIEAVFEQQKKMPRRRIESNSLQADSFVITGMQGLKKMAVRGYAKNGEVRGITILYDQAMEGTMDQLVAPMSSAFVPFTSGFAVAGSRRRAAPQGRVRHRRVRLRHRPRAHRPQPDRQLQRHRAAGPRQRRARRHRCQRRARAAARLWRAQFDAGRHDRRHGAGRHRRHAARRARSAGAKRRGGDLDGERQARRRTPARGRWKPRRRWASPAPPRSMRRAASPAWW